MLVVVRPHQCRRRSSSMDRMIVFFRWLFTSSDCLRLDEAVEGSKNKLRRFVHYLFIGFRSVGSADRATR